MYYKVIVNEEERIVESKEIRELVKENKNIEIRKLDNTKVDVHYFEEKQHRDKKEETVSYLYKKYQQKYYNRLKREKVSAEEYSEILDKLKNIKNSSENVSNFKKECELNKLY